MADPICIEPSLRGRLPAAGAPYAQLIEAAANAYQLDPFALAAICAVETFFGTSKDLDRQGPEGRGDHGHGHGLMQVDDRSHPDFCRLQLPDGSYAWADAERNLMEGARIFREECLAMVGEDLAMGIGAYNGGARAMLRVRSMLAATKTNYTEADLIAAMDDHICAISGLRYVSAVLEHRQRFIDTTLS